MGNNIYTSQDFQSDQTEGFPASLCWDWDADKAWLELNESLVYDRDEMELNYYRQLCKDFGERSCCDADDFNALLEELGEDAVHNAWIHGDDESEEMGGIQLS
jgi:hypothetical protein